MVRIRQHIFATLVIVLSVGICAFLLGKRVGARQLEWRAAVAAHHAAVDHCQALGKEVNKRLKSACEARIALADFEEHFGKAVLLDQATFPEANDGDTHVFVHEPSHRVFYLRFENSVLAGYHGSHGADDIQPHLPSIEERMTEMR